MNVNLRPATGDDARAMSEVDQQSWPAPLAADEAQCRRRIETYAEG